MNEANQITTATRLFGFIAEEAQQNRFAVVLNKRFKANGNDAMMIPMNIRPDDFHFTLSNMKKSHVNGAVIAPEYQDQVLEIVDSAAPLCERTGLCDTVTLEAGQMHGRLLLPEALAQLAERTGAKRIALIGATPLAGATALQMEALEVSLYDPWIETLMRLQSQLQTDFDINRIAEGMAVDFSTFDLLIDFSSLGDLSMISHAAGMNIDLRPARTPSALQQRCIKLDAAYSGYDALLENLTAHFYPYLTKERE